MLLKISPCILFRFFFFLYHFTKVILKIDFFQIWHNYNSLKLGGVSAESKGVVDDSIAKNVQNFYYTYRMNHLSYDLEIFSETILLLKVGCFERISNQNKIDRMVSSLFEQL